LPSSDPARRFQDIIDNIDLIVERTAGMTKEEFFADPDKYDATERRLSRISEAASKLGMLAEQLEPGVPWNNIRGIGNWLRHDYPDVVRETIWQTVREHLAPLRAACARAIERIHASLDKAPDQESDNRGG
jgi:uncharacterized protein with HEPN domain